MGLVFVAERGDPGADVESLEPLARFTLGGVYSYLQDGFQELHEATGQLIHPQTSAFFIGDDLLELEQHLIPTFEQTVCQATAWDQPVGTTANGDVLYERTSRNDVVQFLRKIAGAARMARDRNAGVVFRGE